MRGLKLFNRNVTDPLVDNSYAVSNPILSDSGIKNEDLEDLYFRSINTSNPFVGSRDDFADYLKNRLQWNQLNQIQPIDTKPINQGPFSPYYAKNAFDYDIEREELTKDQLDSEYLERRREMESLEPINVDYTQQASNAISGLRGDTPQLVRPQTNNTQAPTLSFGQKWGKLNASKGVQNAAKGVAAGAALAGIAADIGDARMNANYKNNQGAYVSGAFGKNQMLADAYNTNTAIASTNYNDAMSQYKNINKNIDSQMTTKLSNKQRWGLVGVGAGKGAATGAAVGSIAGPMGTIVGTAAGAVVGAAAGAFKGHNANKQIAETNEALRNKKITANNFLNYSFGDIRNRDANLRIRSMFGNVEAYGGNLYANGGALQDPYGINYIGEGHSHENNRFGGVPVSIAEDGKPNLVEEGEVVYDDYVYSNRIKLPDSMRKQLNLKDDVKTFADAAKAIKERGKERPNDPVMEHTIKAQMQKLKSKQEEVKEKKEQREQEKMLAQMSEQERQMLEQQQMEQQANAYEQQMAAEQQAQMAQQQMPQEGMPQEQMAMQEQQPAMPYAEGGNLKGGTDDIDSHKFAQNDYTRIKNSGKGLSKARKEFIINQINKIKNKKDLTEEQKKEQINGFIEKVNNYQIKHSGINNTVTGLDANDEVGSLQTDWANFGDNINDAIIGSNFYIENGGNSGDKTDTWTIDKIFGNQTKLGRTFGAGDLGFTDEELKEINDALGKDSDYEFKNNFSDQAKGYYGFAKKTPQLVDIQQEKLDKPIYNWRYRPNWIPGAIDLGMLAQAYAPADYSRARSIENTPIREVQYNPNGNYIKPYIIDPRQQYNLNYANAQATNRAIQNNAGGNGANAVAAMLANNAAANQAAAQIGFQADAENADSINKAIAFNNAVDAQNAQGFLQASEANQRADAQRGEFNMRGKLLREQIDAQRGQAISNSLGAVADDFNNYYNDRYNRGMIAGLAENGYFGEMPENSLLRKNIGFDVVGRESVDGRNYFEDENGIHYLTPNGVDYNIDGMNNVYLKRDSNGKYYKTNR